MKTGVVLPSFRPTGEEALTVARRADALGVDGVFCYDHLWPMGRPDRPALAPFPLLAAIAASTGHVAVGPLVARVGMVPDQVLVSQFEALAALAPGRVVAALGTGDRLSAAENEAYGIPFGPAEERREAMRGCVRALKGLGFPVWVGVGARATAALAEEEGVAVNMWGAPPGFVSLQAVRSETTWAGPAPELPQGGIDEAATEALMVELDEAGATWAVFGWPVSLEVLVATARRLPERR